jgi:hypothetical protein
MACCMYLKWKRKIQWIKNWKRIRQKKRNNFRLVSLESDRKNVKQNYRKIRFVHFASRQKEFEAKQ